MTKRRTERTTERGGGARAAGVRRGTRVAAKRAGASKVRAIGPAREKAGARIREHRLDNGLRVLLAERHFDPIVSVMLWYHVGSRHEAEHESGVSHFLEHMMFKGSRSFGKGEVDAVTTSLGGNNNAYTSADHTAYWFELASDRWEKALEIEADRMKGLLLDPAEFEAEKAVVLEELAMGKDDPWRSLTQQVQELLFPRHPYRRPIIGYADTLTAMDVGLMRDYYARHYHTANATLVLCGDFDPERALALVQRHFGSFEGGPVPERPDPQATLTEPTGERRLTMTWDDHARRLCMAWPTVRVGTDDDFRLDLVATLLSGGRVARLYRRLVLERGIATSISTHNDTHVDTGVFWLYAEAASGVALADLERAVDAEIAELAKAPVSAAELTRAKRILRASEAHENETVTDLAEELGEFAVDAHWHLALDTIERVEAVRPAEVRDAAARYLTPARRVVGWCVPRDEPEAGAAARRKSPKRKKGKTRREVAAQGARKRAARSRSSGTRSNR